MFKLNPAPTFVAEVPLSVPGHAEPSRVLVTFRHKNRTALQQWIAAAQAKADVVLLDEVIVDIAVHDENGDRVPYNADVLGRLIEHYPIAHSELFQGYTREMAESKRKN